MLTIFAFLMRFTDIHSKLQGSCRNGETCNNNNNNTWQPNAAAAAAAHKSNSNSSSTSSGCCDSNSNASSKENFFAEGGQQQHHSLTPQQLEQLRQYQQLQQQQLQLLQQQFLQRRRFQQQLRAHGVNVVAARGGGGGGGSRRNSLNTSATSAALTCNQQYLLQQRLQQQQHFNNKHCNNNDMLNNNNNNNNNNYNYNNNHFNAHKRGGSQKELKSRRGMTEFSTINEINNKSHLSQPFQNSPRHTNHNQEQQHLHHNSPLHFANINQKHLAHTLNNNKNNQETLPLNSSANIANISATTSVTVPSFSSTSTAHSPLHHYRNPLNSPNNSQFTYAAPYGNDQQQSYNNSAKATAARQHLLQQHLRSSNFPSHAQTQYQQHLNDLLLQQQYLQQQQQQLLSAKDAESEELSEESLKQNVEIVLNNLDRYNNALRSIILNEQVTSNSSVFLDDSFLLEASGCNNNFQLYGNTMAAATAVTPESDYNSNATTPGSRGNMLPYDSNMLQQHQQQQQQQQHLVGFAAAATATACGGGVGGNNVGGGGGYCTVGNNLNCSIASSHDFTHDNSDYQWFLDYGYRDGCGGMQRSVLSSLSASYNALGDLIYYEDLAKNLDANLAEVDMESFRAEDIHSLLSQLPSYCKSLGGNNRLQQSLLLHQQQQHMLPASLASAQHAHNMSQVSTTSTNELIDNSICKSELLFSPVKESHLSVDSLDMDAYPDDGDIILTCKANKDNYTIAFEGSVLYSDDSYYEPNEMLSKNKQNFINLHGNLEDIVRRKSLDASMSRSDQAFITAGHGKLQRINTTQLQRYPSGNNNTADTIIINRHAPEYSVRKSNSLPNLQDSAAADASAGTLQLQQQLNVLQGVSTSTTECCRLRNMLPMCQMPISCDSTSLSTSERQTTQYQQEQQQPQRYRQKQQHHHRCCCSHGAANNCHNNCCATVTLQQQQQQQQQKHAHITGSSSSGNSNPPAFNLVKLFIKQKSSNCSSEEQVQSANTCMDVSSGCWPSSDAAGSSSSSSLEQRLRKKSMNDSGKGSALSKHDEEDMLREAENDSAFRADAGADKKKHRHAVYYDEDPSSSSTGSMTVTNSPAHRRRSAPLRNPQLCQLTIHHNGCNSVGSLPSSDNSEQLTQVYQPNSSASERKKSRRSELNRGTSTASSSEMVTRSMQTSCSSLSSRGSFSDRFRCVPPSFLAKLNNLGEERQAPIYVIYPNYALPDLAFVKTSSTTDMIFTPFNYKMAVGGAQTESTSSSLKKRRSLNGGDQDELLKTMDYKHVVDWQSLAMLLPAEYRRRLKHIPEVGKLLCDKSGEQSQRPLFCMSPPIRRSGPHICDCAQYFHPQTKMPTGEEGTSSSGSSQQPSSGYRGSSTLLTDSEMENTDPLKQMYVYQYEQQRMDSGVEMSPLAVRTPPQPMPRGILRKSNSQSGRNKRNSMIEEQQQTKLSKLEKRRSLQEPPNHHGSTYADELFDVFEEEAELYALPQPRKERLSRKDLDARARAENFLSSLPRNELKYYAEIAAILESSEQQVEYDAAALKKEVSHALSQQKKVSFNDVEEVALLQTNVRHQRFTPPPNSPNISMATAGGLRHTLPRRLDLHGGAKKPTTLDEREQRKLESNRFKRLQIQWELMSKDSSMLKELANVQQTKSGGSTPTAANAYKSRIPRPVSYPAGKIITKDHSGKITTTTRSPSRIVPPKRYSLVGLPAGVISPSTTKTPPTSARARTPTNSQTAPNTPKRSVPTTPRTIPRVR